jgi:co-chaperonin GroES (HSP10)
MDVIRMEMAENESGLQELREDLDKNPLGERGPLMKAEAYEDVKGNALVDWAMNAPVTAISGPCHPQFDLPENWVPMGKGVKGRPKRDDVVILQDRYRDELQCRKCSGKGHSQVECRTCDGSGLETTKMGKVACPDCRSSDFDSPALPKSKGYLPCGVCRGTGQATAGVTGLVSPTESKEQPSTGVIMAVGRLVTEYSIGTRVLFSKFAGIPYECDGRVWRVMKQTYPIMEIVGDGDVQTREGL